MTDLRFPYESPRPGQKEVSEAIESAALRRQDLVVEAPNGFGKTAAALAAVARLTGSEGFSCVYAVRTKREMERVLAELTRFAGSLRAAPLISMADGCLLKDLERSPIPPEVLPNYCRGSVLSGRCHYYDSTPRLGRFVPPATGGVEEFLRRCSSLRVCPYFLSRDKVADADVVVTTFPHLIHEALRSQLLGSGKGWRKEVVIFDEAHNLPETVYTSSGGGIGLKEAEALAALSARGGRRDELGFCEKLLLWMRSLAVGEDEQVVMTAEQMIGSSRLGVEVETMLVSEQRRSSLMFVAEPLDAAFILRLRLVELASSLARAMGRKDSMVVVGAHGGDVRMTVRFLDVGAEFSAVTKPFWSSIFLSATFFDFRSFAASLGLRGAGFMRMEMDPLERRCVTAVDLGVTTEYRKRGREQSAAIAVRLANLGMESKGSVACFFPSYRMMEAVAAELSQAWRSELILESKSMEQEEQARAVERLAESKGAMLLGVMGGKFSEGEDFASGRLASVAVVGLPLPPPSEELSARMAFERPAGGPWIYDSLVIVPAVAKVVQAAGRLFRRKGQAGLVVLMDRRFGRRHVVELFPTWMKERLVPIDAADRSSLAALLAELG